LTKKEYSSAQPHNSGGERQKKHNKARYIEKAFQSAIWNVTHYKRIEGRVG
jgi:tRNA(Glu) U13 pseudouridine synthase TruD